MCLGTIWGPVLWWCFPRFLLPSGRLPGFTVGSQFVGRSAGVQRARNSSFGARRHLPMKLYIMTRGFLVDGRPMQLNGVSQGALSFEMYVCMLTSCKIPSIEDAPKTSQLRLLCENSLLLGSSHMAGQAHCEKSSLMATSFRLASDGLVFVLGSVRAVRRPTSL